jgi:hypothetical protein
VLLAPEFRCSRYLKKNIKKYLQVIEKIEK